MLMSMAMHADGYPRRFRSEPASNARLLYLLASKDPAANHSAINSVRQLLRMKPPLDSMALPISDAAKILDGLAVLLEQASDSLATESAEVLRAIIKTYPDLAPEVGDADIVSALTIALKHGCEFLISDLQAAVVPALEAALGLLSARDSGSFTAAATLAAPSLVSLFAPQQQLVAIPSLAPDTAKAAVRALCILAKDEDPEVQDILLAVGAIPVLTRLTASGSSDVKQLAAAALAALAETTNSQAMQQAIRQAGDVFAATNRLTATATSSQLADLLAFLTNDVASQANAQATSMVIGQYTDVRRLFMPPLNESGQSNLGKRLEKMYADCLASDEDTYIRRQVGFAGSVVDQLSPMRHQAQERALRLLADVTIEEQQCERIVMASGIIPKLAAFLQKPENPAAATLPARMVAAYLGQLAARSLRLRSVILDAGGTKILAGLITRQQPKLAEIAALALAALQSRPSEAELADSAHELEEDAGYGDRGGQQVAGEKPAKKRGLFRSVLTNPSSVSPTCDQRLCRGHISQTWVASNNTCLPLFSFPLSHMAALKTQGWLFSQGSPLYDCELPFEIARSAGQESWSGWVTIMEKASSVQAGC